MLLLSITIQVAESRKLWKKGQRRRTKATGKKDDETKRVNFSNEKHRNFFRKN